MENGVIPDHHRQSRLRYINSFYNHKTFAQTPRRTQQRLIPLTREIRKTMMNFNISQSSSASSTEKPYNAIFITNLVKEEVHNALQELAITNEFIRKEEIDSIIEKCLRERVYMTHHDSELNGLDQSDFDLNHEIEVIVEQVVNEKDKNKLVAGSPKNQKINTEVIKEECCSQMTKMDDAADLEKEAIVKSQLENNLKISKGTSNAIYDEIYYKRREYIINLLNYKKSVETMELNRKANWNPYVKPVNIILPERRKNHKQTPMFLITNN